MLALRSGIPAAMKQPVEAMMKLLSRVQLPCRAAVWKGPVPAAGRWFLGC